jgi:hypothetical protein
MKIAIVLFKSLILFIPFLFIAVWAIIILFLFLLGRIPVIINDKLNIYLIEEINQYKPNLIKGFRIVPQLDQFTDSEISSLLDKTQIPLIAVIGLVIFISGSIWQLIELI